MVLPSIRMPGMEDGPGPVFAGAAIGAALRRVPPTCGKRGSRPGGGGAPVRACAREGATWPPPRSRTLAPPFPAEALAVMLVSVTHSLSMTSRPPPVIRAEARRLARRRCALDTQVQADIAYLGDGHIKFHLGPVFFVLKEREAALSMRSSSTRSPPSSTRCIPTWTRNCSGSTARSCGGQHWTATAAPASTAPSQPPPWRPAGQPATAPPDTAVPGLGDGHPPARPARTPSPTR